MTNRFVRQRSYLVVGAGVKIGVSWKQPNSLMFSVHPQGAGQDEVEEQRPAGENADGPPS
jgi:hypothetical protein